MKNKHFFVLFFKAGIDSLNEKFQRIKAMIKKSFVQNS